MSGTETQVELQGLDAKVRELSSRYEREAAVLRKLQQARQERLHKLLSRARRIRSRRLTPDKVVELLEDKEAEEEANKQAEAADSLKETFQQLARYLPELAQTESAYLEAQAPGGPEGIDRRSWQQELRLRELRRIKGSTALARRHRGCLSEELHTEQMQLDLLQELSAKINRACRRYLQPRKMRLSEQMGQLQAQLKSVPAGVDEGLASAVIALKGEALAARVRRLRDEATRLQEKMRKIERSLEALRAEHVQGKQQAVLAGQASSRPLEKLQSKIESKTQKLTRLQTRLGRVMQARLQATGLRFEQVDGLVNGLQELVPKVESDISSARAQQELLEQKQAELRQEISRLRERAGTMEDVLRREGLSLPTQRRTSSRRRLGHRQRKFLKGMGYFFGGGLVAVGIGSLIAWLVGAPVKEVVRWAVVAIIIQVILVAVLIVNFGWRR